MTRDRVAYDALWRAPVHRGGHRRLGARRRGLQAAVAAQAERAMQTTDAVLVVVDASVGATATEEAMARVLRRRRPVILAVNKVDDERAVADAAALWSLGLGEPYPVSALHGRGSGDLLDAVLEALPDAAASSSRVGAGRAGSRWSASRTSASRAAQQAGGESRSVVHEVAGTTVDPVDSLVELDGQMWRFVDTAGLRRRVNQAKGMEFYARCAPRPRWRRPRWRSC